MQTETLNSQTAIALESEPSANTVALAIADYGKDLSQSWAPLFAYRVAKGDTFADAYRATHVRTSEKNAISTGHRLACHPKMRQMIAAHLAGPVNLARAATVVAVEQLIWLCVHSDSHKVRLDAANSLLDRGGVPKSTSVQIEASLSVADALAGVIDITSDAPALPVHTE